MKLKFALGTIVAHAASARILSPKHGAHKKGRVDFDADASPNVIMGTGIANGNFTIARFKDRDTGAEGEIGLRAKFRSPPSNEFPSNGDGSYSVETGRRDSDPTDWKYASPLWSYEWHINTDVGCDADCLALDSYEYELFVDSDPTFERRGVKIDPINDYNGDPRSASFCWDHSLGNDSTDESGGVEAGYASRDCSLGGGDLQCCTSDYSDWIGSQTVAQNSWQPNWFIGNFNPEAHGIYNVELRVFKKDSGRLAEVKIRVEVDDGTGFPADKEDCKNWDSYGPLFNNKKECSAFVHNHDLYGGRGRD